MKKQIFERAIWIAGACIILSFAFSLVRMAGHDECMGIPDKTKCPNTACSPLFIDRLEPFISTRWFCEIK